jgi:hypothetical protein
VAAGRDQIAKTVIRLSTEVTPLGVGLHTTHRCVRYLAFESLRDAVTRADRDQIGERTRSGGPNCT